jgi:hypothetical protein
MNHTNILRVTVRSAATSLLVLGLASAGAPAGAKAATMRDDLLHRSPDIHWPAGFEPSNADLFAHNEILINASRERVWKHIVDANRWPTWCPNSRIAARVHAFVPCATSPDFAHAAINASSSFRASLISASLTSCCRAG